MKKFYLLSVVLGALLIYSISFAGMDMGGMKMGEMKSSDMAVKNIKNVTSRGYKFEFNLIDMKMKMKKKGMEMDMGGMSHHLMVFVKDEKSGAKITDAKVKFKIFAPNGDESQAMAMLMNGGYGADVNMSEKGKYGIACMVKIGDKKELVKFNYVIK